jgi:hypothetical protein
MLFYFSLQAQETCVVKLKEIKGVYTGACSGGKANGTGKSVGTDQYEGLFKDGYPDGKGAYIWKDGHYFVGLFSMGKKDGKGDMYYENINGSDSVISGYWKKDKYIGEYEKQFMVVSSTSGVSKVDCSISDMNGADINITVHQLTNSSGTIASPSLIPFISEISTVMGTFYTKSDQKLTNSSVTRIQLVTFPFKAIFYLNNGEQTQILFNTKGNYDVYIDMQ